MLIHLITVRRVPDVPSPLLVDVVGRLRRMGHRVSAGTAEEGRVDACRVRPEHDLYVLKSHTELALSVAGVLAEQGAPVLNSYQACAAAQDKLSSNRRLRAAGVPVPSTFVTGSWRHVADAAAEGPVVVKPLRGHRGAGVEVVSDPAGVVHRPDPTTPLVVQEHVPGPGEDLKVYVVGHRVWAVRKRFGPQSFSVAGRPVAVSSAVRALALRTAEVTGLVMFGVDVIESPDGPVVVDLNHFPGYKGCEGVAGPIARCVDDAARGRLSPRLPPLAAVMAGTHP